LARCDAAKIEPVLVEQAAWKQASNLHCFFLYFGAASAQPAAETLHTAGKQPLPKTKQK
jgi:hypothetical protein